MKSPLSLALLFAALPLCSSCKKEEAAPPIDPNLATYDEVFDTFVPRLQDFEGAYDAGVFEGTFAVRSVSATLVDTPTGERRGGGVNYRLLTRTYDADTLQYQASSVLCGGENFEVSGVGTNALQESYRDVPESSVEFYRIDHSRGVTIGADHVQLWAIDLDDPLNESFPETKEVAENDTRVFDVDEDGNPGVTLFVSGIAEGEVYAVQRKYMQFQGMAQSEDVLTGFVNTRYDSIILGASNPLFEAADPSAARMHPDENESWFEEVRVEDDVDCDAVMQLSDDDFFAFKPAWVP